MKSGNSSFRRRMSAVAGLSAACLAAVSASGVAHAAAIDTGNPDVQLRWDNTLRYNAGWRVAGINKHFANSPRFDETERKFKRGDMITNRVDFLSELELVYKNSYGFRISAAAWTDAAYNNRRSSPNPALAPIYGNSYAGGRYNSYVNRFVAGPSGEILDAFVFGNFDLGAASLQLRVGSHNVYWGDSMFSIGNSIAYSQGPVDTLKAATSPGAEAKELFMPLNQVSAQLQIGSELSFGAQYQLDWKPFRLVPGGTFFAGGDATRSDFGANACGMVVGGNCVFPIDARNGRDISPSKRGNYGVYMHWSPAWLEGTAGLYYRKFDERVPWGAVQLQHLGGSTFVPSQVRLTFARDTELYGLSLNRGVGKVSVGSEISYRKNTALISAPNMVFPAGAGLTYDEAEGPRGNTWHALINGIYLVPRTALWDAGTLVAELTYQRLDKVTRNRHLFNGTGYACPSGQGKKDGCATRDAWGANVSFTPDWMGVMPGWNLKMPISLEYGLHGNGAAMAGVNEGAWKFSVALTGTYRSVHEFSVRYVKSHADYTKAVDPLTGLTAVNTTNGNAVQNSHDWVGFTYKTTF